MSEVDAMRAWQEEAERMSVTMTGHRRFQYIHFVKTGDTGKTTQWECRNNKSDEILGEVRWYSPWRQYIFLPINSFYSAGCLQDVITFIAELVKERSAR